MFIMIEAISRSDKYQELLQTIQELQRHFRIKRRRVDCLVYTDTTNSKALLIMINLPSKNDLKNRIVTNSINVLIGAFEALGSEVMIKTLELKKAGGISLLKQFNAADGRKLKR